MQEGVVGFPVAVGWCGNGISLSDMHIESPETCNDNILSFHLTSGGKYGSVG